MLNEYKESRRQSTGTLRWNAPRIWVHLEAIMDFTVG